MITLIGFFELDFLDILLVLILPFLTGLLVGWFLWGKYKRKFNEAANERDDLYDEFVRIKEDLENCKSDSAVGNTKGQKPMMAFGIPTSKFFALKSDNLQIIEGIGPKMSEFLQGHGINSWETLAGYDEHYLKNLLKKEGNKYRIIDPTSWPAQANLANKGAWEKLITLQKSLAGGKKKTGADTSSKIEKIMTRLGILKQWKKDDLKAIEGIGPKIEKLCKEAGIKSWTELSKASIPELKEILTKAGSKFKLADPGSWAEQAKLADAENWAELEALQDTLKGGKKS